MQEESQGYAKFIRFLVNLPSLGDDSIAIGDDSDSVVIGEAKLRMTELIGTFDLDPNRCLDLTLDALEAQIRLLIDGSGSGSGSGSTSGSPSTAKVYASLRDAPNQAMTVHVLLHVIQLFPVENVTHLIGFKFSACSTRGVTVAPPPMSLFLTTGVLASHCLLSLPALQPHLPPLKEIEEGYADWKAAYQKKIKKMGVVSLNSKTATDAAEDKSGEGKVQNHQLIQLFHVLLEIGLEWDLAVGLFNGSGDKAKDMIVKCCCVYPPLGLALCDILDQAIAPMYNAKVDNVGSALCLATTDEEGELTSSGEHSLLPLDWSKKQVLELATDLTLVELCTTIEDIMEPIVMSGSMASNTVLYTKLCRLVSAMLLEQKTQDGSITEVDEKVLEFLERVLVSSLSLFPFNPAIASELWSVLSLLPYQLRYALYASWRKHGLEKAALRSTIQPPKPLIQVESMVTTGMATKYLLKRMSKDNIKDMGRQASKIAHNNPLVVFTLMLNQIESYDNLILMMVETFKFMGVLSLDVIGYCLLVSLGGEGEGRNKLKGE